MDESSNIKSSSTTDNIIIEITKTALIPTAIASTLGYFIGWSKNAAYYIPFGLSPSLIQKSIPETLTSAWVELSAGLIGIIIGIAIYRAISVWFQKGKEVIDRQLKLLTTTFFIFFIPSTIGLIVFTFIQNTIYRFDTLYIALMGVSILLFWTAAVLGNRIYGIIQSKLSPMSHSLFRLVYPSFYIYLFATILMSVFFLSRFAVWRGHTLAIRDLGDNSSLPSVTLYSKIPLPFQDFQTYAPGINKYENLKLVDMNDKYMFVLENQQSQPLPDTPHVYIITKEKVEFFELFR